MIRAVIDYARWLLGCWALALLVALVELVGAPVPLCGLRVGLAQTPDSTTRDYRDELVSYPPLEPARALESFEVADGLRLEIVAAEPEVVDPVAMTFDELGRLYVIEMRGYSEQADEHLSRVRLLVDRDGDGRYEQSSVFADGFDWPTGIVAWDGGVFVASAPDILFLRDRDGDGRADERRVVFTGFGRQNVQALVNNLQWGVDNWLHGATSNNPATVQRVDGATGQMVGQPLRLDGRDFAWHPRTGELVVESGGGQHGMTFDAWGHKFICSNSDHLRQVLADESRLARNPWLRVEATSASIAEDGPAAEVFRLSPVEPWRIIRTRLRVQGIVPGPIEGGGRAAGYFTSATGLMVYTGDHLPEAYRGRVFIGDVGGNLVHQKQLEWQGVQAVGRRVDREIEFLRSRDTWFRPVQIANGPDGALYVIDMYREVIEHPWSLPPVIKQHLDLTHGRDRGRIYRVVRADDRPAQRLLPGEVDAAGWVRMLGHPNGWHRLTAARLLCERPDARLADALRELVGSIGVVEHEAAGRMHALWVLADWQQLDDATLSVALADPHPRVRHHAVRLAATRWSGSPVLRQRLLEMGGDLDAQVRQEVGYALGHATPADRAAATRALLRIAVRDADEPWTRLAVLSALDPRSNETWREAVELVGTVGDGGDGVAQEAVGSVEALLVELAGMMAVAGELDLPGRLEELGRRSPGTLRTVLWKILSDVGPGSASAVRALGERGGRDAELSNDGRGPQADAVEPQAVENFPELDAAWSDVMDRARRLAEGSAELSGEEALDERRAAVRLLAASPWDGIQALWDQLVMPRQPPELQTEAIDRLLAGPSDSHASAIRWLVGRLNELTPDVRQRAVGVLLTRPDLVDLWLPLLDDETRRTLGRDPRVIERLRGAGQPRLRELADQLAPEEGSEAVAVVPRYVSEVSRLVAAAERRGAVGADGEADGEAYSQADGGPSEVSVRVGAEWFGKRCGVCHGPRPVGPPLEVVKSRGVEQLVVAVLDPNREVDPRYESYLVELVDGRVLSGVLVAENAGSVTLGLTTGETLVVLRSEIERLVGTGRSLMPEGLHRELSPESLASIVLYLRQP